MIAYDFPHRLRTPGSARREIRNLTRSLDAAGHRQDTDTVRYLEARQQRARAATRHLHGRITADTE